MIYAKITASSTRTRSNDFRNEIRSYFGTGTQLQEMYITPSLLTDAQLGRPGGGREMVARQCRGAEGYALDRRRSRRGSRSMAGLPGRPPKGSWCCAIRVITRRQLASNLRMRSNCRQTPLRTTLPKARGNATPGGLQFRCARSSRAHFILLRLKCRRWTLHHAVGCRMRGDSRKHGRACCRPYGVKPDPPSNAELVADQCAS